MKGPDTDRADALRRIGFNSSVSVEGQELHVQTEVAGSQSLRIRSIIFRGGTLIEAAVEPLPTTGEFEAIERFVRDHHQQLLSALKAKA